MIKRYLWNLLIAIDQLANAIAGGDPDETISSRVGKLSENGKAKPFRRFIDWLFYRGQCKDAIEIDEGKDQVARK